MAGLLDNPELASALGIDPAAMRQQALNEGLLGGIFSLAAQAGPQMRPVSALQALGGAGMAGYGMYRGSMEEQLKSALQNVQVQDMLRKRQAEQNFQNQIAAATRPAVREEIATEQGPDFITRQAGGVDQNAADRAVLDYLRVAAPTEYAKLLVKEPKQLPADIQSFLFAQTPEGGGFKGTYQQFLASKTPSTNVSLSTEKSYGGALAGKVADQDAAKFETAQAAPKVIENVQSTRNLLEKGNVFTGIGATQRLDLARAGDLLGVTGKDTKETIANTQQLFQNRAQATLDSIRSSGLGSGQGFSNKDREFLENARLGNITYSKEALMRQLDLEERVAKASIQGWNSRLQNIPKEARTSLGLGEVPMPSMNAPRIPRYNPATGRVE